MDYSALVDQIEQVLTSLSVVPDATLRDLAEAYTEACREVNRRLQEVYRLIRAGERSEAIRRAEMSPRLLDVFETLNPPDRDAWIDICVLKGLPTPPELLTEHLSELQEAYQIEEGLGGLLRQHRVLALAQAPLHKRIAVLRELVRAEPLNPVWVEDLKVFERAWLESLQQEIQECRKRGDVKTLEEILRQLDQERWLTPLPVSLVAQCRSALESLHAKVFRQQLTALGERVREAVAQGDPVLIEERLRLWESLASTQPYWVDPELRSQVSEAFAYRQQVESQRQAERRRQQVLQEFQDLLANARRVQDLEHHYAKMLAEGITLPEPIQQRYEAVCRQLRQRTRVRRVTAGLTLLALVCVAGVAVWQVQAAVQESRLISETVAACETLIETGKLSEAQSHLDTVLEKHPSLVERSEIISLKEKVLAAQTAEEQRRQKFGRLVAAVKESLAKVPDGVSLQEAEKLAKTEQEKAAIADLKAQAETVWEQLRLQAEEQLKARLTEIAREFDALQSGSSSVEDELDRLLKLRDKLRFLESENHRQGTSLNHEIADLQAAIDARFLQVSNASEEEKFIREVCAAAARGPVAYLAFIKGLKPEKHEHLRIPLDEFQLFQQEFPYWQAIDRWNTSAQRWNDPAVELTVGEMDSFKTAFTLVQVSPPESIPFMTDGQKKIQTLFTTISKRELLIGNVISGIYQQWNTPLISNAWLLRLKDGRRYFSLEQPVKSVKVLRDRDAFHADDVAFPREKVDYSGRAPQSILYERIRDQFANWGAANWETASDAVLGQILQFYRDPTTEPIEWPLIFDILYQVWSAAKEGDIGWAAVWTKFEKQFRPLREKYSSQYDWVKTAFRAEQDQYSDIREVLEGLPPTDQLLQEVRAARDACRKISWPRIELVGVLFEDANRRWYVRPAGNINLGKDRPLFVVDPGSDQDSVLLRQVGRWSGNHAVIAAEGAVRFYNGRLVVAFFESGA